MIWPYGKLSSSVISSRVVKTPLFLNTNRQTIVKMHSKKIPESLGVGGGRNMRDKNRTWTEWPIRCHSLVIYYCKQDLYQNANVCCGLCFYQITISGRKGLSVILQEDGFSDLFCVPVWLSQIVRRPEVKLLLLFHLKSSKTLFCYMLFLPAMHSPIWQATNAQYQRCH